MERIQALLKRPRKKAILHVSSDAILMKPPNPKRAKLEADKRVLSDLLDGVFYGINTEPRKTAMPPPPPPAVPNFEKRLTDCIISWIQRVIVDTSEKEVSAIGFHGIWPCWMEVSKRRGVIWKGPSMIDPDLLDATADTKSKRVYTEYVSYFVYHMTYQLRLLSQSEGLETTASQGYFFVESSFKNIHALELPREFQSKIKPNPGLKYTASDDSVYVSGVDIIPVLCQ